MREQFAASKIDYIQNRCDSPLSFFFFFSKVDNEKENHRSTTEKNKIIDDGKGCDLVRRHTLVHDEDDRRNRRFWHCMTEFYCAFLFLFLVSKIVHWIKWTRRRSITIEEIWQPFFFLLFIYCSSGSWLVSNGSEWNRANRQWESNIEKASIHSYEFQFHCKYFDLCLIESNGKYFSFEIITLCTNSIFRWNFYFNLNIYWNYWPILIVRERINHSNVLFNWEFLLQQFTRCRPNLVHSISRHYNFLLANTKNCKWSHFTNYIAKRIAYETVCN